MADETDLEISITTTADTSGAEEARAAVEGVGEAAEGAGQQIDGADKSWEQMNQENAQFSASNPAIGLREVSEAAGDSAPALEEVSGGLREILGHIPGFNTLADIFGRLGTGTMGVIAAGITAIGSAIALAGKSLSEFAEKEKQVSELDQILANTGQLTNEFRVKLQELADQFEETTGIGDERFLKVMSTLVKFGATSENIDELTHAVVNMSGAIGVDVERAATLMGKAMHGNVTMLQRYGIHVTKGASDTEKLNQVMEQLATRGGGVLEGRTHTLSGGFTQLHIAVGNFFEGLGNIISRSGIVQSVLGALSTAVNALANLFPKAVEQTSALKNNLDPLRKSMGDASDGAEGLSTATDKAAGAAGKHKTALESATDAIKADADASKDAADATLKLAEAEVKLLMAQGKISKEEGALRITQLKEETEIKKLLIEKNALLLQQEELKKVITQGEGALGKKDAAVRAAEQRYELTKDLEVGLGVDPTKRTPEDIIKSFQTAERDVKRLELQIAKPETLGDVFSGRRADEREQLEAAKARLEGFRPAIEPARALIKARGEAAGTEGDFENQINDINPKLKEVFAKLSAVEVSLKAAELESKAGTITREAERRAHMTTEQRKAQDAEAVRLEKTRGVTTTGGVGANEFSSPKTGELERGIRAAGATDPLAQSVDKLINVTKEVAGNNARRSEELERKIQELQNQMRNNDRTQKLPGG